ncbi:LytR C-terminal domain-containing protein [Dermabacteraceae bacterium TAE3-ERU27]|nr:LytR C-terminal domain-containing protein [Dermabacteraceae bacterium TAE3-ERU27]
MSSPHLYGHSQTDVRRRRRRDRQRKLAVALITLLVSLLLIKAAFIYVLFWAGSSRDDTATSSAPVAEAAGKAHGVFCPSPGALPAKPETVTVRIFNGTQVKGLAARNAKELTTRGFKVKGVANTQEANAPLTLRYGRSGLLAATAVAAQFPRAEKQIDERSDNTVDIIFGEGYPQMISRAQASKLLEQQVVAPEGCVKP